MIYNTVQTFFSMRLSNRAIEYASNRRIKKETLDRLGVGFWPYTYKNYKPGKVLLHYVEKMCSPIDTQELIASKLFIVHGDSIRDNHPESLTFPILHNGEIVSFSSRSIDPVSLIKHYHMPGNKYLFNEEAVKSDVVHITEGLFDCLTLEQLGYSSCSTLGVFPSREAIQTLLQAKNIVICYDFDLNQTGAVAALKLARRLVEEGHTSIKIRSADWTHSSNEKADMNSLLCRDRVDLIQRCIENAKSPFTKDQMCDILKSKQEKDIKLEERKKDKKEESERVQKVRLVPITDVFSRLCNNSINSGLVCCILPGHRDSTASMGIKDGRYHCFGCGRNGDNISLVMEVKNYRFWEAIEYIEDMVCENGDI